MGTPGYIANFDSMAAMVRGTANCLKGKDLPLTGAMPRWTGPGMLVAGSLINRIPRPARKMVYIWSGWGEAISPRRIHKAKVERIAQWIATLYPRRKYPAIAIGSSNGAAVHLYAALGIPWLPQTFLVPVARSGVHPDEPTQDVEWADETARTFLKANPDVQLHHMHDPNQDRLMIRRMTYFRAKLLRLGKAYEDFIERHLAPGGTLFVAECRLKWPTTKLDERYVFQFGALGGAEIDEFRHGGERVRKYLDRYDSHRRRWESPEPDADRPEAEWGFESSLREDIERLARRNRYRIRRIVFEEPEHLSPLVADLYRWWNIKRGVVGNRMLVESFILLEPYWTIRTGSTPYWMVFNKQSSLRSIEDYLDGADPFDEIFMMLFSHGVESVGLVSIEKWKEVLGRAKKKGEFLGVDEEAYPRDFAVFARYCYEIGKKIKSRYPAPPPLTLGQLDEFLERNGWRYPVRWH